MSQRLVHITWTGEYHATEEDVEEGICNWPAAKNEHKKYSYSKNDVMLVLDPKHDLVYWQMKLYLVNHLVTVL
jgi:hypothetical protein